MFSSLNSPPKLNLQKQLTSKDCIPKPASLSSHYCLFQFETNTVSLIPLITLVCKGAMFVCYLIKWLVFCPPHHMGVYTFSECKCYQQCIKSTAFWCETRSIQIIMLLYYYAVVVKPQNIEKKTIFMFSEILTQK